MMGGFGRKKLCIVCSVEWEEDLDAGGTGKLHGSGFSGDPDFSQFCEELVETCGDGNSGGVSSVKILKSLEECCQFLFLCSGCLPLIRDAEKTRAQVERAEVEVLKLQLELLRKMEALRECTQLYLEGMGRIYEKVSHADLDFTAFEEVVEQSELKRGILDDAKNGRRAVVLFREKIMDAAVELGIFQDQLKEKLCVDLVVVKDERNAAPNDSPLLQVVEPLEHIQFPDEDDTDCGIESPSPNTTPPTRDSESEEKHSSRRPPPTGVRRPKRGDQKTDYLDGEADIDDDDDVSPKKKIKKARSKPKPPKAPSASRTPDNPKPLQLDLSKMTHYKGQFIKHILVPVPSDRPSKKEPSSASGYKDPEGIYLWDYDPSSDTVTLSGHSILIEENGSVLVLICSLCDFRLTSDFSQSEKQPEVKKLLNSLSSRMFDHIVGLFHLDAFKCTQCSKQHRSLRFFKIHMKTHDPDAMERKRFFCEQCGYRTDSKKTLNKHMIVHMEGEERREALRKLERLPLKGGGKLECKTCGKSDFISRGGLKNHQETHLELDKRPTVICPKCGVRMLKRTYHTHITDGRCPKLEGSQRVTCEHCGKSFTRDHWRRHVIWKHSAHGGQKPWQCEDCGKRFLHQRNLRSHQLNIHHIVDDSTHPCKNHCGKRFATIINLEKHEAKCEAHFQA